MNRFINNVYDYFGWCRHDWRIRSVMGQNRSKDFIDCWIKYCTKCDKKKIYNIVLGMAREEITRHSSMYDHIEKYREDYPDLVKILEKRD